MRKPVGLLLLVLLAQTACVSDRPMSGNSMAHDVVLDVRKTALGAGDGCEVDVFATYPADMPAGTRELTIFDSSSELVRALATVELPRPENDPRQTRNADGTSSFRMFQWSFSQCRPVPLVIEIGTCESGNCPPMVVSPETPAGITVEVVRTG